MPRVTQQDIVNFNNLYLKYHTFAEVARRTGFSAGTVSKYVDKNYAPVNENSKRRFSGQINDSNFSALRETETWGLFLSLSEEEEKELKELWKEITI